MAPGYFWIDDVSLEQVGDDVPLTEAPVLDTEEAPIAPPGEIVRTAVRCSECGYRNNPDGGTCYACGTRAGGTEPGCRGPGGQDRSPRSRIRIRCRGAPWSACMPVDGRKSLRLDRSYASLDEPQDWLGYDFLKADLYTDAREAAGSLRRDPRRRHPRLLDPGQLLHRRAARARARWSSRSSNFTWARSLGPAGCSILGQHHPAGPRHRRQAGGPLFLDNLRLERDDSPSRVVLRGAPCLRFRYRHQPRDGGLSRRSRRPPCTARGGATA